MIFRRRTPGPHRTVLYSQPNCTLCVRAAEILDELGVPYETAWRDEFVFRIPVIEVDGRIVAEGRIDARAVRRAVR